MEKSEEQAVKTKSETGQSANKSEEQDVPPKPAEEAVKEASEVKGSSSGETKKEPDAERKPERAPPPKDGFARVKMWNTEVLVKVDKCNSAYEVFLKSGLIPSSIKTETDLIKSLQDWIQKTPQIQSIPMFSNKSHPQKEGEDADPVTIFHLIPLCFSLRVAQVEGKLDDINDASVNCNEFIVSDAEQFKASVSAGGYKALNNGVPLARSIIFYKGPNSYFSFSPADEASNSPLDLLKGCQLELLVHKNKTIKVIGYALDKYEKEMIKKEVKRLRNNEARRKRRASNAYAAKERERDNRTRKMRRKNEDYRKQEIARDNARRKKRRSDPEYRKREAARDNAKRQARRRDPEYRRREAARDNARRKARKLKLKKQQETEGGASSSGNDKMGQPSGNDSKKSESGPPAVLEKAITEEKREANTDGKKSAQYVEI